MTKIKICGLMTFDDALYAAEAGADMLGFNFYKGSPRYLPPPAAFAICAGLRKQLGEGRPLFIGLFVNESVSNIVDVAHKVGLDAMQLSGDESRDILIELGGRAFKAIRPMDKAMALDDVAYYGAAATADERLPTLLLDAYHPRLYGGTGHEASEDVSLAVREKSPRVMLAGGLKPDNVAERVRSIQPWGVDVASGVEKEGQPGVKDRGLVKTFIEAVQFA